MYSAMIYGIVVNCHLNHDSMTWALDIEIIKKKKKKKHLSLAACM